MSKKNPVSDTTMTAFRAFRGGSGFPPGIKALVRPLLSSRSRSGSRPWLSARGEAENYPDDIGFRLARTKK